MLGCPYITRTEALKAKLCVYGDQHVSGAAYDFRAINYGITLTPDLHVFLGDLTFDNEGANWALVDAGLQAIETAGQQYLYATGNHDVTHDGLDRMGPYCASPGDAIFTAARLSWYAGHYGSNMRSGYITKQIAGRAFLFLALEYGATYPIMVWADAVVKAFPNHIVIVTKHDHLYKTGAIFDRTVDTGEAASWNPANQTIAFPNGVDDCFDGQMLRTRALPNSPNGFLTDNTNIRVVLCGHSFPGHYKSTVTRAGGTQYHEILINHQDEPSGAWFRTIEFDFASNQIISRGIDYQGTSRAGTSLLMVSPTSAYDFAIVNAGIK